MDRLLHGPRISRTIAAVARFIHTFGYKTQLVKPLQSYSRTDCSINRHFENEKGQLCCASLSRLFWNEQVRARMCLMQYVKNKVFQTPRKRTVFLGLSVFHLRWKCFISDENLVSGGVLSDVSLGIKNHPPNPNGSHVSAFDSMNN